METIIIKMLDKKSIICLCYVENCEDPYKFIGPSLFNRLPHTMEQCINKI